MKSFLGLDVAAEGLEVPKGQGFWLDIYIWLKLEDFSWPMPSGKCYLTHDITEYMSFIVILSMVYSLFVAPSISWNTSTTYFWLDFSVLEIQKGPYHIPQLPKQRAKSSFFIMLVFFWYFVTVKKSVTQMQMLSQPLSVQKFQLLYHSSFSLKPKLYFRNKTLIELLCGMWHTSQGMHGGRLEDNVWASVLPSSLVASAFTYCALLQHSNYCNSTSAEVPLLKLKKSGFG